MSQRLSYRDYLQHHYSGEKAAGLYDRRAPGLMCRFPIAPQGAVRLSGRDAFRPTTAAKKYFAWKDRFSEMVYGAVVTDRRFLLVELEARVWWKFLVAMPPSWSKKKRALHDLTPCCAKPDWDNCAKAVYDAIFIEDKAVHDVRCTTLWTSDPVGMIEVWKTA
jgi:Holliday junction resolvase RusA-like endonuclease